MLFRQNVHWQERLQGLMTLVRSMSEINDPQEMVRAYGQAMRESFPTDGFVAISRRGLGRPYVRITRSHLWDINHDPWKNQAKLPLLDRGILSKLIYDEEAVIIDDLHVEADDPAYEHLAGFRTLSAIPQFDGGASLNMIISLNREPGTFDLESFPERVWMSNLFGRATQNLVLAQELKKAGEAIDRELRVVGEIQRSLLPTPLPVIAGLELAAHYQTSRRAGGDYYDFFPIDDGRWGIFIADVSGHGTPAAVMMAMTHTMAHAFPGEPTPPARLLTYLNQRLTQAVSSGSFVTAFYGIYDPATRQLRYASAGHNPPRVMHAGSCQPTILDPVQGLPLAVEADETYDEAEVQLHIGDTLLLYTDGITETFGPGREMYGTARLDQTLCQHGAGSASDLVQAILASVRAFAGDDQAVDDRTLLVARVTG
jgi:phosphoserine phosphatase RsbU/P